LSSRIVSVQLPLAEREDFDEIIDVRSPSEYAEDHLTGAVNLPVLSNEERARVGTLYRADAFAARRLGAGFVSVNIGRHLEGHLAVKPGDYRPLIYCWRGGQRSHSLATVLAGIGWRVGVIDGGYKAYRKHVVRSLEERAESLSFRVVNGLTGSGKTRLLRAIEALGGQILDLEGLARHKGSVFGAEPGAQQPAQKRFESLLHDRLKSFDPARPVFVEAESPKIGRLNLPRPLWVGMRNARGFEVAAPMKARIEFLKKDYATWLEEPERIRRTIERLRPFHSRETIFRWMDWCERECWNALIEALLSEHYDRRYEGKSGGYFQPPEVRYDFASLGEVELRACARRLLDEPLGLSGEASRENAAIGEQIATAAENRG